MIQSNVCPLAFYNNIEDQNHRKTYAFDEIFSLVMPARRILPFQIVRGIRAENITSVVLHNYNNSTTIDITNKCTSSYLSIQKLSTYDVIVYNGLLLLDIDTPEGQYYIEISDSVETWYSEIFAFSYNMDGYLKLEYWNADNIEFRDGCLWYGSEFYKSTVYLDTQLGMPEYTFDEASESRDGYIMQEKQVSNKIYKFVFLAAEYMLDALRLVRLHDYIQITSMGKTIRADSFLISPKWEDGGYLASVDAEFTSDTIVKKIGTGIIITDNGDFNEDFNYTHYKTN